MNNETALVEINKFFTASYNHTAIAYQNVDFDTTEVKEYVKINIIIADNEKINLSNPGMYRQEGFLSFQIFCEKNTGVRRAYRISDQIAFLFRSAIITGIKFKTPDSNPVGDNDKFYQMNLFVDFWFDTQY